MIVCDLETFDIDRAVPFANVFIDHVKFQINIIEIQHKEKMKNVEKIVLFLTDWIILMKC